MQNKIKLCKIIEHALNHTRQPIIIDHHNRDFINDCVQTLSEKSIALFKQGKPVDTIIIPISLNDEGANKLRSKKMPGHKRDSLLESYALSKIATYIFEIAGHIAPENLNEGLIKPASEFQQIIKNCGEKFSSSEKSKLANFSFDENSFADLDYYCEKVFKNKKAHVLFIDIYSLSEKLQMRLNEYVQLSFGYLTAGYAVGKGDLKTLKIMTDFNGLEDIHGVKLCDVDKEYWQNNIYIKADQNSSQDLEYKKYIAKLNQSTQQLKLPLREYL